MTQTITDLDVTDVEPAPATEANACFRRLDWCAGECEEGEESPHHGSPLTFIDASRWQIRNHGQWTDTELSMTVFSDDVDGLPVEPRISLITADLCGEELSFTAEQARRVAAHLLNCADMADPIPSDVLLTTASALRLHDELLTEDGWQTITGLMFFLPAQVSVFTNDERHDEETDGWQFGPADPMKVRRPMHAAEPALNRSERIVMSANGWCARCRADRVIVGPRVVSIRGVIRVRGHCQTCNKGGQNAAIGLTPWAVDAR